MNGSYELKLVRLMRYALRRSKEAGNPDAEKWRGVFRLSLRATRQAIAGELAPERLTALDPFFKRYAIDGRADGGAGSGQNDDNLAKPLDKSFYSDRIKLGNLTANTDGGPGSGNFGHAGRPGKVGGSESSDNASSMTEEEIGSLKRYKSSDSYKINAKLRYQGYENLGGMDKAFVDTLDSALKKLPRYQGNVCRTLLVDDPEELETFIRSHGVGEKVTYKAYSSFSKTLDYNDDANIRIYIRNSKKGCDMAMVDNGEHEVLYGRNSAFIVSDVVQSGNVWHILEVEV